MATNWQNFTEIHLTQVKILQKVLGGYFFDSHCIRVSNTLRPAQVIVLSVCGRLLVEFPPTGGAIPTYTVRTVKLLRYVSAMDFFILACECMFVLFIIYYVSAMDFFILACECMFVLFIIYYVVEEILEVHLTGVYRGSNKPAPPPLNSAKIGFRTL